MEDRGGEGRTLQVEDLTVSCRECGRLFPRTIAYQYGWRCVDERYDLWLCPWCAAEDGDASRPRRRRPGDAREP
ncbi:MAG: hypothetical protein ACUVS5_12830 [Anaerolineae bacterium]